jgi:hypothetical protein
VHNDRLHVTARLLETRPGAQVAGTIRRQTGASPAEARELLERSVAAFWPQKARHLVWKRAQVVGRADGPGGPGRTNVRQE